MNKSYFLSIQNLLLQPLFFSLHFNIFILEHSPNPLNHHNPWFKFLMRFHVVSFLRLQPISSTTLINHTKKCITSEQQEETGTFLSESRGCGSFGFFFFFFKKRKQYLTNLLAPASFLDLTLHYIILFWVVINKFTAHQSQVKYFNAEYIPSPHIILVNWWQLCVIMMKLSMFLPEITRD